MTTVQKTKKAAASTIGANTAKSIEEADLLDDTSQTILDKSLSEQSTFSGFFVVFWLGVFFLVLDIIAHYYLAHGFHSHIVTLLLTDLLYVGLTDLAMYLATYFGLLLHVAIRRGLLSWSSTGWIVMSAYEVVFFVAFLVFQEKRSFPWIAKIFLFLHQFVLLMKMHSYAFSNGHYWQLLERRRSQNSKQSGAQNVSHSCLSRGDTRDTETDNELLKLFPQNINLSNFFWYSMFPTIVYQIKYKRTSRIRWFYVVEKLFAIFGVISLMIVLAQNFMYPFVLEALSLKKLPVMDRLYRFPLMLLDIIPVFLIIYILNFYLIWDAILNCIAELTRFGSRDFYEDWWNCTSWLAFSRKWNTPVHKFLLKHVYHSSISCFQLSKSQATLFTFLLSSVVHELAMYVIFHKLRCYLFLLQMFQLPLIALTNLTGLNKGIYGNIFFWLGIMMGPSLTCSLYLIF